MSDTSAEQAAVTVDGAAELAYPEISSEPFAHRVLAREQRLAFQRGARWQRERPVSEAEVEAAVQMWMRFACPRHDETPGGTIEEDMRAALEAARRVGDGNE